MSCEETRPLLEAFVDGELAPEAREDVARHLDSCVSCHKEAQALFELASRAREELGPVKPARDLWPGIAGRIGSTRRFESPRRSYSAWWLAAAALLGVAVGAALMQRQPAVDAVAKQDVPMEAVGVTLASWEREIMHHRTALLASLDRQRDRLPAESVRAVEENLRLIDEAIQEIRSALQRDPDNPQLNFLLADAYQQEVQLLKRLSHV